jgi:hypothetical protein
MQPSDDRLTKEDARMNWALLIICSLTGFLGPLAKYFALETAPLKNKSNPKERRRTNAY